MQFADYHIHSHFSMDSQSSLEAICEAAIAQNLFEICLTDHYDPGHPDCDHLIDYGAYFHAIDACRTKYDQLTIRIGLEIGDNAPLRTKIEAEMDTLPLDFRLLSLHLVDGLDPYDEAFFSGRTKEEAYRRYVEVLLESVLHFSSYDAVAHLGYCGKFAPFPPNERALRWHHAPDHLDMILRHLAREGKALEINTSTLKKTDSTIPGRDIIRRFAQLGGEFVTLGSDAHVTDNIAFSFDDARRMAVACGIRYGATFDARQLIPYALED